MVSSRSICDVRLADSVKYGCEKDTPGSIDMHMKKLVWVVIGILETSFTRNELIREHFEAKPIWGLTSLRIRNVYFGPSAIVLVARGKLEASRYVFLLDNPA